MSFENVYANRSAALKALDIFNYLVNIKQEIDYIVNSAGIIINDENPQTTSQWELSFTSQERADILAAISTLEDAIADIGINQPDLYAMLP